MSIPTETELLTYLETFIYDRRKELILETIKNRTRFITVVLENVYHPQNASAVLRTCECFGIQDVHVIEKTNKYEINKHIVKGATKWLDIHYYRRKDEDNTKTCIQHLKSQGYKIIATTPHDNDQLITDFIPNQKCAIVFGSEEQGISNEVSGLADGFLKIPIYGFTESYNISDSAGIILNHCVEYLQAHPELNWHLSENEIIEKRIDWSVKSIKKGKEIMKHYQTNQHSS
jgi:tRNA (guanosine-2'-O-)-methyltransferase